MYMIFISRHICVRSHTSKFTSKDYDVNCIFRLHFRDTFIFLWSWLTAIAFRLYNVFGAPTHFFVSSDPNAQYTYALSVSCNHEMNSQTMEWVTVIPCCAVIFLQVQTARDYGETRRVRFYYVRGDANIGFYGVGDADTQGFQIEHL